MSRRLTVAVTGPTGELGTAIVAALERAPGVERIVGMARRPDDPGARGWTKTEYRQGDVTDRPAVRDLVRGADVVVHLAFAVAGAGYATRAVNVEGSRVVFEEAARHAERICHASSVAAYGFGHRRGQWVDEGDEAVGSAELPYSAQKAEVEGILASVLRRRRRTAGYVLRPSIVAGPRARILLDMVPHLRLAEALPPPVRALIAAVPGTAPVLPDFGVRLQLVHEADVAAAFAAAALGAGPPGTYNLAGEGTITLGDLARALGWRSVPVPTAALDLLAETLKRAPAVPAYATWVHFIRNAPMVRTERARQVLGWTPEHTARDALASMVAPGVTAPP